MSIPSTASPVRRKWSPLLMASLALNLLIVGTIAGAVFAHRGGMGGGGGPPELNIGRMVAGEQGLRGFVRTLPKERRAIFRASGEQARQALKPLRLTVRKARDDATLALKSEPFDAARYEKAMGDLIAAEGSARRAGVAILASAIGQMTPAEREQFQSWRRKHERGGPPPRPADSSDMDPTPSTQPPTPPQQPR
jgi:uncharacterized membrane protein